MKRSIILFLLNLTMLMMCWTIVAADNASTNTTVQPSDGDSIKSLMIKLWGKLKSVSPKAGNELPKKAVITTAGIRGTETTDTLLTPYWKDDLSTNKDYIDEVSLFSKGNDLAGQGDFEKAIVAFESFLANYPKSDLIPNAKLALGMAYGEFGEKGQAVRILGEFVETHEGHVLLSDAKQLLELMI